MRILTTLLLMLFIAPAIAQNNNVVTAYNLLRDYRSDKKADDIAEALKYINMAAEHEKTIAHEKTWRYRGQILREIGISEDPAVKAVHPNPLMEAYRSFAKANELDEKGSYKSENDREITILGQAMINKGVEAFKNKKYEDALSLFENSIEITSAKNIVDTLAWYNAALASEKSNNYPKAAEYYNRCAQANYGGAGTYLYLSQAYINMKDTAQAFTAIQTGRKAFPEDKNLIIEELGYYLRDGKDKEARENLILAIKADPGNHVLHFALGTIYDKFALAESTPPAEVEKNIRLAEDSYKKALEIKPDYFDVLFNLGALHVNYGVKLMDDAETIKDNAKYKTAVTKAEEEFKLSVPYLEKAHELNPTDRNTMITLKQIYARMLMSDKYKKMEELLKN